MWQQPRPKAETMRGWSLRLPTHAWPSNMEPAEGRGSFELRGCLSETFATNLRPKESERLQWIHYGSERWRSKNFLPVVKLSRVGPPAHQHCSFRKYLPTWPRARLKKNWASGSCWAFPSVFHHLPARPPDRPPSSRAPPLPLAPLVVLLRHLCSLLLACSWVRLFFCRFLKCVFQKLCGYSFL